MKHRGAFGRRSAAGPKPWRGSIAPPTCLRAPSRPSRSSR